MQFQVATRVKKAVDRNSLLENYGAVNTQPTLIVSRQNGMQQASRPQQRQVQPSAPPPQPSRRSVNPQPVPCQVQPSAPPPQPSRQPVNPQPVPRQVQPSAPPRQPRKPLQGTILKEGRNLHSMGRMVRFRSCGLGWIGC